MKEQRKGLRRALVIIESLGLGLFYVGMLGFFLYPVADAAGYFA